MLADSIYHCVYATVMCVIWPRHQPPHKSFCVFTRTQGRGAYFVYTQSARLCKGFYNVLGEPTATNGDTVGLLRRCRRFYCVYFGVLHYLRTQWDRLEEAAPLWQGFKAAFPQSYHSVVISGIAVGSQENADNFYKFLHEIFTKWSCFSDLTETQPGVSTELPRRVTAFPRSSTD